MTQTERTAIHSMTARYTGSCRRCGQAVQVGDPIEWDAAARTATHVSCPSPVTYKAESGKTWWRVIVPVRYADLIARDIPADRINRRWDEANAITLRVHRIDRPAVKAICDAWPVRPVEPATAPVTARSAPAPTRPISTAPRRNTRPSRCDVCGQRVLPGEGFLRHCLGGAENCALHDYSEEGGWHVTHVGCAR